MDILYYDCFSGISGDMNLGALLDIGVDQGYLERELGRLKLAGYKLEISRDNRKGIYGTLVNVSIDHSEHHEHRGLNDIRTIIESSSLNDFVKETSMKIFIIIAQAEAKVHGTDIEKIHFHEIGAIDSIVDVVGGVICIDMLKPSKIYCSPVELGGGFVNCAHGKLPVPVPAVTEILRGIPVKSGAVDKETTTPTGAAILKCLVNKFTGFDNLIIEKTAYGIGHRDNDIPNVLRVISAHDDNKIIKNNQYMIECNIDDMNPEIYDIVIDRLFSAGALDVFLTPIIMKKNRPAIKLSVLCGNENFKIIEETILRETTTFGLRKYKIEKTELEREFSEITTKYGKVRIKSALIDGKIIKSKAEYDDIRKISEKEGIAAIKIHEEIDKIILNKGNL